MADNDETPGAYPGIERIGIDDYLAYAVRQRRLQGGLTQEELQQFGGPSEVTVRNIENGKTSPSLQTLAKLDKALRWPPGLAAEIAGKARRRGSIGDLIDIATDLDTIRQRSDRVVRIGGERNSPPPLDHAIRTVTVRSLSYEDLWRQWADLFLESLAIEMEYARRRGLTQPAAAREELWQALSSSQQMRDGSPWQPPWIEVDAQDEDVTDDAQHTAPSKQAGGSPATRRDPDAEKQEEAERLLDELMSQGDYRLAAHEPDDDIEREQEETEREP